jgi:virulence-associated protein VagC
MNREVDSKIEDELLFEYDFSQFEVRVRGKYVECYRKDNRLILDPIRPTSLFSVLTTLQEHNNRLQNR